MIPPLNVASPVNADVDDAVNTPENVPVVVVRPPLKLACPDAAILYAVAPKLPTGFNIN